MENEVYQFLLKNIPGIDVKDIAALNEGLFAYTWDVCNKYVVKISKICHKNEYQDSESDVLKYIENKINIATPKLIKHARLSDGREIIIEEKISGMPFSYEIYRNLSKVNKKNFLIEYGKVCAEIHSIKFPRLQNRLIRTAQYQKQNFHKWFIPKLQKQLNSQEISIINDSLASFEQSASSIELLPCHADLHFNNIMVSPDTYRIKGIIDFGAFHYADPAYEFRYMLGESQSDLEIGYGKSMDESFQARQFFYCICMFLMGAVNQQLSWVSSEQNIQRLKKLIACKHMQEAYR